MPAQTPQLTGACGVNENSKILKQINPLMVFYPVMVQSNVHMLASLIQKPYS